MKWVLALFLALFAFVCGEEAIWIVGQDFVKFGKKDVYEKQIKTWNLAYGQFTLGKEVPPITAFQDSESPQYLYFIPMANYGALDGYFRMDRAFRNTVMAQQFLQLQNTTLNFYLRSIHEYLAECSYATGSFPEFPFVHYFVYAIVPGYEGAFENRLRTLSAEHKKNASNLCWRTWKVVFDSDIPKYEICLFAKSEEDLAKQIDSIQFVQPSSKEMVRRERSGKARLRLDLLLTRKIKNDFLIIARNRKFGPRRALRIRCKQPH